MKKIGRKVLFLKTNENCARNGEGDFIRLNDNTIMLIYTDYSRGNCKDDHGDARLSAIFSCDEGETWGDKHVILTKDAGEDNVMSVSLIRMKNGDIGLFYLQIGRDEDGNTKDSYLLRRSSDEGKTWGEAKVCIPDDSYHVVNNDRVVRLENGRLIIPAALHKTSGLTGYEPGIVSVFYSDDDGETWQESERVYLPFENDEKGLQEPGVIQREDGTVHMWLRTDLGFQFETFSSDMGEKWSAVQPNKYFSSPCSPMQIKRVGEKYTVAIFNPVPRIRVFGELYKKGWGRTPYVCAVSLDGGLTFTKCFYLEDDLNESYCYPAIIEGNDYFMVAYYHSNGSGIPLNSLKILKIMYDELENE